MSSRIRPNPSLRAALLEANANRCCVCKKHNVGLHFHHIDGDSSNTVAKNLAVLCVEDHDRHHRPSEYKPNHVELDPESITKLKISWEAFVANARGAAPDVRATITAYGTLSLIHSVKLALHWPNQCIEHESAFHLLECNMDQMTDRILAEVTSIGIGIKIFLIDRPMPIEHCPCCGTGLTRTVLESAAQPLAQAEHQR